METKTETHSGAAVSSSDIVGPPLQCCQGRLSRSRTGRCKHAATWVSTVNGKRTNMVWCDEHRPKGTLDRNGARVGICNLEPLYPHPADDPNHVHPHDCGYTVTGHIHNCDCRPNEKDHQ